MACRDQWRGLAVCRKRDLIAVRVERRLCLGCGVAVAGLGGLQQRDCGVDVALQQGSQLVARLAPVERLHGIADLRLVVQQSVHGELGIGKVADEVHDRALGPRPMGLPQRAHRVMQRERLRRDRPVLTARRARVRQ